MRILFICGSINQTRQLEAVARALPEHEHRFTPFFSDGLAGACARLGLAEMTIAGRKRRGWCLDYLRDRGLPLDVDGEAGGYGLVVTSTDVIIPRSLRSTPIVGVQEGILDPERVVYRACRAFPFLPRWLAGTAFTGLSPHTARFCAASEGYRQHFIARGASPDRIVVTGIPNFDDCKQYLKNSFPHRGYVLVCTSDARETFKIDLRRRLIRRARSLAAGRQLIFKLHPNEQIERATREIAAEAPESLVFSSGSAEEMIANCSVLLTQWSSTSFVGVALGKEVHSNIGEEELRRLCPVQNGGASAANIAGVCREVMAGRASVRAAAA